MEFLSQSFNDFLKNKASIAVIFANNDEIETLDAPLKAQIQRAFEAEPEKQGWHKLNFPAGLNAANIYFAKTQDDMRALGGALVNAQSKDEENLAIWGADAQCAFGAALRNYQFEQYKSKPETPLNLQFVAEDIASLEAEFTSLQARVEGVHLARNLVNEPANILTTSEFAARISALESLGVKVEILEEDELESIGMNALLGVGQGSESPSKVALMHWENAGGAPLALVGKGVVFDTGGISIKPSAGMEEMIMDMGGAATVVGTMHSLAKRQAKANVIGIVGLVENMPDGKAQRPGDIVKTLKGDSVEVLNTDAEGRLVLADILWYVQERYSPSHVVDLATLTGAIIIALGVYNAGIFGNDDAFVQSLLESAKSQNEGAWHMPLGEEYAKQLKSKNADLGNIGGREAGSITAAEFLHHFIQEDVKWIHIDIAGTATAKSANDFSNQGATGWGVLTLDHLADQLFTS